MKITKNRLKQLIKEEMEGTFTPPTVPPGGRWDPATTPVVDLKKRAGQRANKQLNQAVRQIQGVRMMMDRSPAFQGNPDVKPFADEIVTQVDEALQALHAARQIAIDMATETLPGAGATPSGEPMDEY